MIDDPLYILIGKLYQKPDRINSEICSFLSESGKTPKPSFYKSVIAHNHFYFSLYIEKTEENTRIKRMIESYCVNEIKTFHTPSIVRKFQSDFRRMYFNLTNK